MGVNRSMGGGWGQKKVRGRRECAEKDGTVSVAVTGEAEPVPLLQLLLLRPPMAQTIRQFHQHLLKEYVGVKINLHQTKAPSPEGKYDLGVIRAAQRTS